jgi:hypothetical protein
MGIRTHYLQRPQIAIIFLSFVLIALPLSYAQLSLVVSPRVGEVLLLVYMLLIGNTHFAITGALYFNSANLRYFESSRGRAAIYFLVPALILVGMFALDFFDVVGTYSWLAIPVSVFLAAADRFHVLRQSFGVFEMFKARASVLFPRSLVKVDNLYFLALWILQLLTFTSHMPRDFDGTFDPSNPFALAAVVIAAALLVRILVGFAAGWRKPEADRTAVATALAYLMLQTCSALLNIYRARLYLASLAMHYVEYHVLMAPRLFTTPLDLSTRVDRIAAAFRRHPVAFYAGLFAVSASMSAGALFGVGGTQVRKDTAAVSWMFVNLLNGVFLFHYFLDGFVWKFSNPFYRETLGPVYFAPPASLKRDPTPRRRGRASTATA